MASRKPTGKLTLPLPDDLGNDDDPTIDDDPAPVPKLQLPKPKPRRIPLLRVAPEKSGLGKLVLGTVALLLGTVIAAFVLAPDGKSTEDIARARLQGVRARDLGDATKRTVSTYKDRYQLENPELIVYSPAPAPAGVQPAPPPEKPVPERRRHAKQQKPAAPADGQEQRYGFERTEQPKRHYDNFDASRETGNGIPMLMVFSKPSGMNVEVDGQLMGMSPLIRPLPKDTKRVKVRLSGAGFKEWEQTVSPNAIEQFRVGVTMHRIAE